MQAIASTQDKMYQIIDVHISQIKPGDTVFHNGELKTVCRNNIKHDRFVGYTLFGDSYRLGSVNVRKVIFCYTDNDKNIRTYNH